MLIVADQRFNWLESTGNYLSVIATPFYWIADAPERLRDWGSETLVSRRELVEENARLQGEALVLQGRVQKLAALAAENVRLRELLNSSTLVEDTVVVAEIVGVSADPSRHTLVIDQGSLDGVSVGQPVIDARGLLGQVVDVGRHQSRVLLLTDSTHAVPVQVNRNGVRAVAEGIGLYDRLELPHVAATTDIRVGDLLVTSGLGGRFPVGYPVAVVGEVSEDPGQPFVQVVATPSALVNRSRHVLLVYSDSPETDASAEPQ